MDSTASTPQTPPTPSVPLDVTDQQNSALLEDTLNLLNAGAPDKAGEKGLAEIDRWAEVLRASERPGLAKIIQELTTLREQLNSSDAEAHDIAETLATLGAETSKVADETSDGYSAPLAQLGKLLIKLGSTLSR
ncbi:ABC-type transporter Mla subunit MlaD [Hymenobacter luteus]|uniref:ABC-type transporter Mla subunit MlaD n=2 Tax=Hymenobacter TaxID=89966 RepID=A0A7W9SY09_9BACT|nr:MULTISPECIES: hypothetical protein [Hymenobacter]MBB4599683.1 ABC-type transporter Mla subunit MlaD [Hymenobacter latericoloratus]MBB6058007.1 ABC-type transporter Mla subunit MlaD [Hymenobacter luteus]